MLGYLEPPYDFGGEVKYSTYREFHETRPLMLTYVFAGKAVRGFPVFPAEDLPDSLPKTAPGMAPPACLEVCQEQWNLDALPGSCPYNLDFKFRSRGDPLLKEFGSALEGLGPQESPF